MRGESAAQREQGSRAPGGVHVGLHTVHRHTRFREERERRPYIQVGWVFLLAWFRDEVAKDSFDKSTSEEEVVRALGENTR